MIFTSHNKPKNGKDLIREALIEADENTNSLVNTPEEALVYLNRAYREAHFHFRDLWSKNFSITIDSIGLEEQNDINFNGSSGVLSLNAATQNVFQNKYNCNVYFELASVFFPNVLLQDTTKLGYFNIKCSFNRIQCFQITQSNSSSQSFTMTEVPVKWEISNDGEYIRLPSYSSQETMLTDGSSSPSVQNVYIFSGEKQLNAEIATNLVGGGVDTILPMVCFTDITFRAGDVYEFFPDKGFFYIDIINSNNSYIESYNLYNGAYSYNSVTYQSPVVVQLFSSSPSVLLSTSNSNCFISFVDNIRYYMMIEPKEYPNQITQYNNTTNLYYDNVNKELLLPSDFQQLVQLWYKFNDWVILPLRRKRLYENQSQVQGFTYFMYNGMSYDLQGQNRIKIYGNSNINNFKICYLPYPNDITLDFEFANQYQYLYDFVKVELVIHILIKNNRSDVQYWIKEREEKKDRLKLLSKKDFETIKVEISSADNIWGY